VPVSHSLSKLCHAYFAVTFLSGVGFYSHDDYAWLGVGAVSSIHLFCRKEAGGKRFLPQ
jgi:hypothetical protein